MSTMIFRSSRRHLKERPSYVTHYARGIRAVCTCLLATSVLLVSIQLANCSTKDIVSSLNETSGLQTIELARRPNNVVDPFTKQPQPDTKQPVASNNQSPPVQQPQELGQPDVGRLIGLAPAIPVAIDGQGNIRPVSSVEDVSDAAHELAELADQPASTEDELTHKQQLASLEATAATQDTRASESNETQVPSIGNASTAASTSSSIMLQQDSKQPPVYRSQPKQISDPAEMPGEALERSSSGHEHDLSTAAGKKYKLKYHKVKKGKKKKKKLIAVKKPKKKHHHHHVKKHHHHHKKPKKYKVKVVKIKKKKPKKKKKKVIVIHKKHKKHKKGSHMVEHVIEKEGSKKYKHKQHHSGEDEHHGGGETGGYGGGESGGSGGGHSSGGHGHGHYQYAESPKKGAWKMGFKRGNHKHEIERKEEGHKSHFKTEVKWHDKKGKGKHVWDYNHHEKKKGHYHAAAASNEQPSASQVGSKSSANTQASDSSPQMAGREALASAGQVVVDNNTPAATNGNQINNQGQPEQELKRAAA